MTYTDLHMHLPYRMYLYSDGPVVTCIPRYCVLETGHVWLKALSGQMKKEQMRSLLEKIEKLSQKLVISGSIISNNA